MAGSATRECVATAEALMLLGVVGLIVILALVMCWPLRRRSDLDAMQQPIGDQPWWRP